MIYAFGICCGLIVALILTLILHFTAFKEKKMTWLYILFFIIFGAGGFAIQSYFFKPNDTTPPLTPEEVFTDLTKNVSDGWKNTNGGFTFEQIQLAQEDDDCPYHEDLVINLNCHDFGQYICFSFQNEDNEYYNTLFYKTDNGLVLDGMLNMGAHINRQWHFLAWYTGELNTFYWKDYEAHKVPEYKPVKYFLGDWVDNLVSVSRGGHAWVQDDALDHIANDVEVSNLCSLNASELTADNANTYFVKFSDIELIGTSANSYRAINTFYNYLYEQIKGNKYNTSKVVDATQSLCLPIPTEEQHNYPISVEKQEEYQADCYGVYNCDIAVNLKFLKGNSKQGASENSKNYFDELNKNNDTKDKVAVDKIENANTFTSVKFKFTDIGNSDLSNVDLNNYPVRVELACANLDKTKVIVIKNIKDLRNSMNVLLNSNQTWNYRIYSEKLVFENFQGTFNVSDKTSNIEFEYYYRNNLIDVAFGLNFISNTNIQEIDLINNPVNITLHNDSKVYQITFDNNEKLNKNQILNVELGTYSYVITSNQIEFTSYSGSLTITNETRYHLFNCRYIVSYAGNIEFDVDFNNIQRSWGGSYSRFALKFGDNSVNALNSLGRVNFGMYIYDENDRLIYSNFQNTYTNGFVKFIYPGSEISSGVYKIQFSVQQIYQYTENHTIHTVGTSQLYMSDIGTFNYDPVNYNWYDFNFTLTETNSLA